MEEGKEDRGENFEKFQVIFDTKHRIRNLENIK